MKTYYCHHLKKHKIILKNDVDEIMDYLIKTGGWYDAGWCFAYLPKWLKPQLRKDARGIWKNLKKLDEAATAMEVLGGLK